MSERFDFIVVGDGLYANLFLYKLLNLRPGLKVLQIHASNFLETSSILSTAVVAKRNVTKGISPLGDLLLNGFNAFESWFNQEGNKTLAKNAIEVVDHLEVNSNKNKENQFKNRYPSFYRFKDLCVHKEKAYLFYPNNFLNKLKNELQDKVLRVNDLILDLRDKNKLIGRNFNYEGSKIVLALGDQFRFLGNDLSLKNETKVKPVRGSYLLKNLIHDDSFSFSINGMNLIYRKNSSELIFGNSQGQEVLEAKELESLKSNFELFKTKYSDFIQKEKNLNLKNINYEEFVLKTALRAKSPKRFPYFGKIKNDIYAAHGFYKNGYSTCFYASDWMLKDIFLNQ